MSTTVKAKGDFKQVPAGTHPAYCYAVIDLGLQENNYQGQRTVQPQVILSFEFPNEPMEFDDENKPMIMSAFYTASISKKAKLRTALEAWRGKQFTEAELDGFALKNVIAKPCTLTVIHNENGKARITGIGAAMRGISMPAMYNKPLWFDIDEHGLSGPEYNAVPDWIKEIIGRRVMEGHEESAPVFDGPDFDESIPF